MDIGAVTSASTQPPASSPPSAAESGHTAFAGALDGQQQRLAAADVLGSMPPMVAEQIKRSVPGGQAPEGAVDALFKAIKSGELQPSQEQLAARDCLIATVSRATEAFESADAMWATMRQMLGAGPVLADAVQYAQAAQQGTTPVAAVSTREEADAVLGAPIAAARLNWWETAIRFLVDPTHIAAIDATKQAAASSTTTSNAATAKG